MIAERLGAANPGCRIPGQYRPTGNRAPPAGGCGPSPFVGGPSSPGTQTGLAQSWQVRRLVPHLEPGARSDGRYVQVAADLPAGYIPNTFYGSGAGAALSASDSCNRFTARAKSICTAGRERSMRWATSAKGRSSNTRQRITC